MSNNTKADISNIYKLDGRVPVAKAIPFGLQNILAMFVANIAPIIIVAGTCGLSATENASLIQSAMLVAGVGTIVQLYPVWKIGSGLPIVMGISFTFVSILCFVGPTYGYGAVVGAVLVGGIIMILAGIFPVFGALLATLPDAVLGGCTIMMFGTIVVSGLQMISDCGYSQRNITIAALSLSIGIGFTQVPELFQNFPMLVQSVFAENCVAVVFVASIILNLILPKDMGVVREGK